MSEEIDTQDVDFNNDEDLDLDLDSDNSEDSEDTTTDHKSEAKPKETSEQRVARLRRQLAREEKKLGVDKPEKSESKEKATKSSDLGYAEKAFLRAEGIKGGEETKLVQEIMEATGKDLEAVIESKYFQAELKEMREAKASSEAVPKGSKRSGSSSRDSVDFWIAKGELPPNEPEYVELRRKVVNARYARETDTNKFASNSTGRVLKQSQQR